MAVAIYTEEVKRWNDQSVKPDERLLKPTEYAVVHTEQDPRDSAAEIRVTEVKKRGSTKAEHIFRIRPTQLDADGELVMTLDDLYYAISELVPSEAEAS